MKDKDKKIILNVAIIAVIILILGGGLGLFASGSASVSRSVPTTATPSSTIIVTYTASGSGDFGISIIDSLSGSCEFSNGNTEYKDVILSDGSLTRTMNLVMGSSGTCTLSGDYKVNDLSVVNMQNSVVTISSGGNGGNNGDECTIGQTKCEGTTYYQCLDNNWVSQGEVNGYCGYSSGNNGGNNGGDYEPPTFDLGMVLFNVGGVAVTIKLLLIILASLFMLRLFMGK